MISPDNFGKYFNNLRIILKYKLETLEYFERLVRLQELQKRASSRLFFERPILFVKSDGLLTNTYLEIYRQKI